VLSGQAVNSVHDWVKVCICEGADKYDQFWGKTEAIYMQMDAIMESGIEVHGRTFPVRELMGGDTTFLAASFSHAGPSSTHHCQICSQNKMDMALTKRDYRRNGMELQFTYKRWTCRTGLLTYLAQSPVWLSHTFARDAQRL
jgi:hypothetical protein